MNPMRQIRIEKVTLNIGVGQPGEKLDKAVKLLNTISGLKAVQTKTMKRIPDWGVRPNLLVGCKVTIRGKKAHQLLGNLLQAINNTINPSHFDRNGNFSFGIEEYINIPGVEYDVDIGILGLDVAVTLARPGFRISKRKLKQKKLSARHRITKEEAIEYVKKEFNANIGEEI